MAQGVRSFEDLMVWQKAHQFVLEIYKFTKNFPKDEQYGLTSQLRRAAVSIPANIAEAFGRASNADKARFISYSQGSLQECKYYLLLSGDLGYCDGSVLVSNTVDIARLLNASLKSLKKQ